MRGTSSKIEGVCYQLFRPFVFLAVRGPSLHVYRATLPLISTLIACGAFWLLPVGFHLVGDKSVADYMATFFSALPGFFIAALAAVVAFNGGDLDRELPDVRVKITAYGDTIEQKITMRVFLCYLFSYLTIISFIGFFLCVGGSLLAPNLRNLLARMTSSNSVWWMRFLFEELFLAAVSLVSASVVFCAAQGLYFLAERVHQELLPDSKRKTD